MSETPPPAAPPPPYGGPSPELSPSDERLWATLVHVGGILFGFIAPLIGYLVLKDRGPFIRAHTATALNFHLTLLIAWVVGWITSFIVIGVFIIIAAAVVSIVFGIIAAVKANAGQYYTYPIAIRFVK